MKAPFEQGFEVASISAVESSSHAYRCILPAQFPVRGKFSHLFTGSSRVDVPALQPCGPAITSQQPWETHTVECIDRNNHVGADQCGSPQRQRSAGRSTGSIPELNLHLTTDHQLPEPSTYVQVLLAWPIYARTFVDK